MTTLVEILKQNKKEDRVRKEKEDIASQLTLFLETEKITNVLTEAIKALTKNDIIEAYAQVDNDHVSLKVINSKNISFTIKQIKEGYIFPIELLDARFEFAESDKIESLDKSSSLELMPKDIFVEVSKYNGLKLSSDKMFYYLAKLIGVEEQ
jgi:hypothetical protein